MTHTEIIKIIKKEMLKNNNQGLYTRTEINGLAKLMYFDIIGNIKYDLEDKVDFYSNGVTLSVVLDKGYLFLIGDNTKKMLLCDISEMEVA